MKSPGPFLNAPGEQPSDTQIIGKVLPLPAVTYGRRKDREVDLHGPFSNTDSMGKSFEAIPEGSLLTLIFL